MILLNLNGKRHEPELICPHCERPMREHGGVKECGRNKVSRRFFLGGLGMAAAGTAAGLAFTQKAQAALADVIEVPVSSHALSEMLREPVILPQVQEYAPKVHRGGPILITHSGDGMHGNGPYFKPGPQFTGEQLQEIANREGREVIFKSDSGVFAAKPGKAAWSEKWESPSLAHFDGK